MKIKQNKVTGEWDIHLDEGEGKVAIPAIAALATLGVMTLANATWKSGKAVCTWASKKLEARNKKKEEEV